MPETELKEIYEDYNFPINEYFIKKFNVSNSAVEVRLKSVGLSSYVI